MQFIFIQGTNSTARLPYKNTLTEILQEKNEFIAPWYKPMTFQLASSCETLAELWDLLETEMPHNHLKPHN